jgi:hypothetical protein
MPCPSFERLAQCLDRREVACDRACEVSAAHCVLPEGEVDDAVGIARRVPQPVKVFEVTTTHCGTQTLCHGRGAVGSCHCGYVVTSRDQLGNEGGPDVAGGTGDKNAHNDSSKVMGLCCISLHAMRRSAITLW